MYLAYLLYIGPFCSQEAKGPKLKKAKQSQLLSS